MSTNVDEKQKQETEWTLLAFFEEMYCTHFILQSWVCATTIQTFTGQAEENEHNNALQITPKRTAYI